ncbi:MAG: 3'-5' exonuclease DinG [Chroococcopsis gigantea SAG 12.99]|jgi:ATP-dependent DNA helicase DinG|nr:ATP-dependent DNA helicase [Chlorogloea purpurea SAG 13.99]MDV3002161.1 3'-5' exonuclease DinG [Chroococcopsis gigantea SAG 12.99]
MVLLEAEVHSSLRAYLREQNPSHWPHHLTMGRIIARALRTGRSALIQTGSTRSRYALAYLTPALLGGTSAVIVTTEIPQLLQEVNGLQSALKTHKEIIVNDRYPDNFQGLVFTTPQVWLKDKLENLRGFPAGIPTLIDGCDSLEAWARDYLSVSITLEDWQTVKDTHPERKDLIDTIYLRLSNSILSHPPNPYRCYLLDTREQQDLERLLNTIEFTPASTFGSLKERISLENQLLWTSADRDEFTLHISPLEIASILQPLWGEQPVVLIGEFLDTRKDAKNYRQQHGLGEMLTLKFNIDRTTEYIHLYLPEKLPLPNTPEFEKVLLEQVSQLINIYRINQKPIIILIEDVPLKAKIGTILASLFGSKVQVENPRINSDGILVCGWEFWQKHQEKIETPQLLIMATLPIPSPENPLVAGRIAYYKHQHKDWFRSYLLPTAVQNIQKAVMSLRECQGMVAILDSRVNSRSYGVEIFNALTPYARINYLDTPLFND